MKSKRGFTLIELLIVIALLGALAVGLIGAIDPFEQLKKGTDTATRDLVSQVQTAVLRYYAVKSQMPWTASGVNPSGTDLQTAPMVDALANMVTAGELKIDFTTIQATKLDKVWVTGEGLPGVDPEVAACYKPTSKSFQADPNTKFDIYGVEQAAGFCKSALPPGANECYWCIQ